MLLLHDYVHLKGLPILYASRVVVSRLVLHHAMSHALVALV